ncbi:ATP-binding Cassette (ABC) Superfamily, partial [Thraustotheca clavata]
MNWYRHYLEYLNTAQRMSFLSVNASAWFGLRLDGLGVLITSFVGLYAAVACSLGHPVPPGILGLTLIYALPIVGKCNAILGSFIATEQNMISVERVQEYSSVPIEITDLTKAPPSSWPMEGHLTIENLFVKYDGIVALTNVSFEIKAQEKVGICGRTGAGKSSLLHALFRAVPSTGRIVIDGVDISSISLQTLRSSLCFIPQDATLFRGTVRTNLDPYSTCDDASLWEALKQCCLDQVVGDFPQKLNEPITESGENLFSR